jgi:Leucine-rich repeat (LRR) protein
VSAGNHKLQAIIDAELHYSHAVRVIYQKVLASCPTLQLPNETRSSKMRASQIQPFAKVEHADLSALQLTVVPRELFRLTNLTELNLSNNALTKIPEGMGKFAKLRVLTLTGNPLDPVKVEEFSKQQKACRVIFEKEQTTQESTSPTQPRKSQEKQQHCVVQ